MHHFKKIDKKVVWELALLNILIIFVIIPFITQPVHIDDTAWFYMARQIQQDPLHPYSFTIEWGSSLESGAELQDTPLVPYYMALLLSIFGENLIILHLFFIIFPLIAGNSFYFIAQRFIKKPLFPTLLLVSMPTFMVMSHNLMFDVPVLAFSLLSLLLFIKGTDKNKSFLLFLGSLFAGIAYLSKPTAIVLLPLLLLYVFVKQKYNYSFYLFIPLSVVGLWSLHNFFLESAVPLFEYLPWFASSRASIQNILAYLFSNLSYIGGATIFPLFFIWPFVKKKLYRYFWIAAIIFSLIISIFLYFLSVSFISGQYTILELLIFTFFVSSFLFFLAIFFHTYLPFYRKITMKTIHKHSDHIFISLWFLGILVFNSFIVGGAVRYNTMFLPPLILVYFNLLNKNSYQRSSLLLGLFLSTLLMGYALSYADLQYSTSYKTFVESDIKDYNGNVWFLGHHGFQYYMEKNGFVALGAGSNAPSKGDIIIKAEIPSPRKMSPQLMERVSIIETLYVYSNFPIRIQNPDSHAGFYTYGGGFLPFSISKGPLETFTIYKVEENGQ